MRDPWHRDNEDYTVLNTLLALLCVVLVGVGVLKPDRKDHSRIVNEGDCYVWSDGHKTCKAVTRE